MLKSKLFTNIGEFLSRFNYNQLLAGHSMRKLTDVYGDNIGNLHLSLLAYLVTLPADELPASIFLWVNILSAVISMVVWSFFNTYVLITLVVGTFLFYAVRLAFHYKSRTV